MQKDEIKHITQRKKKILIYVSGGWSNKEIAVELNVSEQTIKNHIRELLVYFETKNRTETAIVALITNVIKKEEIVPYLIK